MGWERWAGGKDGRKEEGSLVGDLAQDSAHDLSRARLG